MDAVKDAAHEALHAACCSAVCLFASLHGVYDNCMRDELLTVNVALVLLYCTGVQLRL